MEDKEYGTVKWFSNEKGYGFISPDNGAKDLFVHYSEIVADGFRTLNKGDRVQYQLGEGPKGPNAQKVEVV